MQCILIIFTHHSFQIHSTPTHPNFVLPPPFYSPLIPVCAVHVLVGSGTIHWIVVNLPGVTPLKEA